MTKISALGRQYWPTLVLFAFLLASWQFAATYGGIREYLLPAPLSVWNALWHGDTFWWPHLWTTTVEIIGAFLLAAVVGDLACQINHTVVHGHFGHAGANVKSVDLHFFTAFLE